MLVHLRLASLRLRQGDFDAAKARGGPGPQRAGRAATDLERTLLADAAAAGIALAEGELAEAVAVAAGLRARTYDSSARNPLFGHLIALVGGACGAIAVRAGDLGTAADDLTRAYRAGVLTRDRPILAGVAVSTAAFAEAIGRPQDAAEILGAAASLRGSDDRDDLSIARLRRSLTAGLGDDDYRTAYAAGRSLPADGATARVDPAPLIDGTALTSEPNGVGRWTGAAVRPGGGRRAAPAARRPPAGRPSRPASTSARSATGPPTIRPRTVVTSWVIGLTLTKVCSQPGMVSGSTKVLEPNDSGSTIRNITPCTAPGVRTSMPTQTEIQQKHSAKAIEMPTAAVAAIGVRLDPEADQRSRSPG